MFGDSNVEDNFPRKLLLTNTQVFQDFVKSLWMNNSSANVRLSKTQLSKMVLSGGFFGPLPGLFSFYSNPWE